MRRSLRLAAWSVVISGIGLAARVSAADAPADGQQVATVQRLESQALQEARTGNFDRTDQILQQAASISHDPAVAQKVAWADDFKSQLQTFATERHRQFDELVSQCKLLLKHEKPDYAMDIASRAYLLADDKDAFAKEPWVESLVNDSIQRAARDDQGERWIQSLRLYSYLSVIQPAVATWKDDLKLATRHVRLLAMYTPDTLRALQDSEMTERQAVEQLLHPTTRPAEPSPDLVDNSFKVDWHETLHGIDAAMLWEALVDADQNYYRAISYKDLALGGINGLRAVLTTRGLDKAFPKLADADSRNEFLQELDHEAKENENASPMNARNVLRMTLARLRSINRNTVQLPSEVLVAEFADGAFERLDPFSSMIWPSDLEEFNKQTQGKFSGVGVQIKTDLDGSLRVVTPLEDTPAYKAGIKAGDVITQIDGKSARNITVNQAVRTITGPPDSQVRLTVRGMNGKVKDYLLRRETIHVASVKGYSHRPGGGWDYIVDPQQRIGYIRITNFTSDTAAELNSAIETMKLQHVRGLIMDLRFNPGGLLAAATDVADKFLDHGVIVSTRPDRDTGNQPTIAVARPDPDDCDLPLIVLVNQYSASASEIVSGALKDDHRALIVGQRTFGKGSVQMLFPLTDRSAYLKLTTSHYYLPSGRCIHREENSTDWGVDPDVNVQLTPDQMQAAIDAREELDVLRDAAPAAGETPKLEQKSANANAKTDSFSGKGLLASDPQMAAALLELRLQLTENQS